MRKRHFLVREPIAQVEKDRQQYILSAWGSYVLPEEADVAEGTAGYESNFFPWTTSMREA